MLNKITVIALVLALVFGVCSGYVWIVEGDSVSGFDGAKTGLVLVVNYKEGDPETFSNNKFSLLPYTLKDTSGRDIESVDLYVKGMLQTNGQVTSWRISGTEQTETYRAGETVPKTSASYDFDESGSSWVNGEVKELLHVNLHWSQIEAVVEQYGVGGWVLQFLAETDIEVTFSDSSQDFADSVAPAITFTFTYVTNPSPPPSYSITDFDLRIENGVSTLSFTGDFAATYGVPTWTFHVLLPILTAICAAIALLAWKENQ